MHGIAHPWNQEINMRASNGGNLWQMSGVTRREFLKAAGAGAALVAAGGLAPHLAQAASSGGQGGTVVAVVRAPGLLKLGKKDQIASFRKMIDMGLAKATGKSAGDALKALFTPSDMISIKVNPVGDKTSATRPELARALCDQLVHAGAPENNIILWDRADTELMLAGYKLNKKKTGVRCLGTDAIGYDDKVITSGRVTAKFSKILTRYTDVLINMPVMKSHSAAGVSIALKNHYGSFDRPDKCHDNGCDPFIADVNAVPFIKNKTRLIVVDATRPQYDKGPMHVEDFRWNFEGIVVGFDPVAVDAVCAGIIAEKRKKAGLPAWKGARSGLPKHIETAAAKGLGICDLKKIKVVHAEV